MGKCIADWRDPSDYPSGQGISLKQWAWEFLRRNPNYQADYLVLEEWLAQNNGALSDMKGVIPKIIICEPPALDGEEMEAWLERTEGIKRVIHGPKKYFEDTYHVGLIAPPLRGEYPPFLFTVGALSYLQYVDPERLHIPTSNYNSLTLRSPAELGVVLRLDCPIAPQLERVKAFVESLEQYAPFVRRNHVDKYGLYLRAIDARSEGRSAEEIADIFSAEDGSAARVSDAQGIYNYWSAADRLVLEDYWKLAAMA